MFYSAGTVSTTNGSKTITGDGTLWNVAKVGGGILFIEGQFAAAIDEVTDDTHAELLVPWAGATLANASYYILLTTAQTANVIFSHQLLAELSAGLYAKTLFKPDAYGTLANRSGFDTAATGFIYAVLPTVDGTGLTFYFKQSAASGDWSLGATNSGPAGPAGVGLTWISVDWASGNGYLANQALAHNGSSYRAKTPHTASATSEPGVGATWTTYWHLIAQKGDKGDKGDRGWAPICAVVTDGLRRVLQVTDWTGGEGTKPATGSYIGSAGLTTVLANAVDVRGAQGIQGDQGDKGWAPIFSVVIDGTRRVLQVADWVGGAGTKPAAGDYVGPTGLTSVLANAVDIRGPQGLKGDTGDKGWTPVLSVVSDGPRRVQQVVDWTGGQGAKPATGDYVGPTGLTSVLADAVDIRGAQGLAGAGSGDMTIAIYDPTHKEADVFDMTNMVEGTTNKILTDTERTKLAGIAANATANATDAALRDRATHTGTQSADTIVDGTVNHAFTVADDTKLAGIAAGATANSTDAVLKARANHTGTQLLSTISDAGTAASKNVGTGAGQVPVLDGSGLLPSAVLPSYVDDVLEFTNLAGFPGTGTTGKIYVALDTGKIYRWSGSAYVEISASPGSTDAVTEGATNLYFTVGRVLAAALTGLSTATNAVISATDTVLSALGKLQKQITDLTTTVSGKQASLATTSILELNASSTGDRYSLIDFHSDDTNTDYSMRVGRNPGVNGAGQVANVGTGGLDVSASSGVLRLVGGTGITYNGTALSTAIYRTIPGNITISAAAPSGGVDGDMWFQF